LQFRSQTGLPVIACLMDLGAGGAYYLATASNHIMAHPTTVTGGIGVILNLYNLQDTMAQANVEAKPIKAGQYTDLGTPIEPLSPEGESILQQAANEFHARFRDAVRASRGISAADNAPVFDGRIFTAAQARDLHLIDSIGYLDDALFLARQQAGCPQAGADLLHRPRDRAKTIYDATPNTPLQANLIPFSVPGLDRSRLPTFLYLWQPEPTMERLGGK
jgi:protease-4